ncbi:hypothetical protein PIB30_093312 [Stylosanthes scabra]|uniref:RNase H type-1 domain-containing protein n=1 Tax=Stylosanthes scabra TaxID=79078 RepID=A0ABU6UYR0_9FABA|nr:hypothetical protein [Stylosanthes scabra]
MVSCSSKLANFDPPLYWIKPDADSVKLNCDGSVFFEENRTCFGCVLRDCHGTWIRGCYGKVNGNSVLRDKLVAIWRGLMLAKEMGFNTVLCDSDSPDAVGVANHWKIPTKHADCSTFPLAISRHCYRALVPPLPAIMSHVRNAGFEDSLMMRDFDIDGPLLSSFVERW